MCAKTEYFVNAINENRMKDLKKILVIMTNSREAPRNFMIGITKYAGLYADWIVVWEPALYRQPISMKLPTLLKDEFSAIVMESVFYEDVTDLIPQGYPLILCTHDKIIQGYPNVINNWEKAGDMAAEYLLKRGFKSFAYCGFRNICWSAGRLAGYESRISQAGYKVVLTELEYMQRRDQQEEEQNILIEWVCDLPKPVAIMACNDDLAIAIIDACKIASISIPDEIAIIGVDDDKFFCSISHPTLSSIGHNDELAGFQTAELIDNLITGKEKISDQRIIVNPTHITTRQSTDIIAVEDVYVSDALRFIQKNSNRPIQVDEVADAAKTSRRGLEKKFNEHLKSTIHNEIERNRCERVARLLLETNLSISQISIKLDFSEEQNLARSFKKVKNVSPSEFRKKNRI